MERLSPETELPKGKGQPSPLLGSKPSPGILGPEFPEPWGILGVSTLESSARYDHTQQLSIWSRISGQKASPFWPSAFHSLPRSHVAPRPQFPTSAALVCLFYFTKNNNKVFPLFHKNRFPPPPAPPPSAISTGRSLESIFQSAVLPGGILKTPTPAPSRASGKAAGPVCFPWELL